MSTKTNITCMRSVLLLMVCLLCTPFAEAQTVYYKTETSVKLHMLGRLGNMMGNKPMTSEFFVDSMHMRSNDGDRSSTIFSIPDGTFTSMDNKKKTYFEMTFDQMMSMFSASSQEAGQSMDEAGYNPDDLEFSISVEDLGGSEKIAGYNADRKLLRMEVKYTAESTDDEGNAETASGKFYAISEVWVSKGVPGEEIMNEFGKNYADKMGKAFANNNPGFMAGMQQAFMSDGRMKPAMEKLAEEMKKLEGTPLKTISYLVVGPEDQELDIDAILNKENSKAKKKGGLGRLARGALRGQGINIGGDDEPEKTEGITEQAVLTETETIYLSIEVVGDDPGRYTVPGNYKQVDTPAYFQTEDREN